MITRFKLVAAMLGLAVATAGIGDASAKTIVKSVTAHTGKTTKVIVSKSRPRVGIRIVHRAPVHAKVVKLFARHAVVRVIKRAPLQRQVLAHRVVVRKTIIR